MKKSIALLLCAILLLGAGCSPQEVEEAASITTIPTQTTTAAETEDETTPTQSEEFIPDQVPMSAISLPLSITNEYTEDDVLLFSYKCQTISLIIPDSEIEQKVILDIQNRLDSFNSSAQEISDRAKSDYSAGQQRTNYYFEVLYQPQRIDLSVLSLYGENTSWVGGAHPTKNCISSNYDLMTGDVLTLGSILTHEDKLETLCQLLIDEVAEIKAEKFLFSDYEDIIRNRFSKNESYNESWFFSNEGLSFYFSPYEIAPYSSGVITLTIPYQKLTGVIEDRYFPAERDIATGILELVRESETDLTAFTQIAEVILDADGEMIFLYTDHSVHNVTIDVITKDINGNTLNITTVFSTPILTPGDAVMLQALLENEQSTVRVSYESNEETITKYLSFSEDGTAILTDK